MGKTYYHRNDLIFQPKSTHHHFQDLEGYRFGRIVVLGYAGTIEQTTRWFCLCDCGNITRVKSHSLKRGITSSCGCFGRERSVAATRVHGEGGKTPEYRSYNAAKDRCTNPNSPSYDKYGGRGIEFRFADYVDFLAEMGRRPSKRHTVDRIDVNGHYEKGNVRWATPSDQQRNRTDSAMATLHGRTMSIWQWAEELQWSGGTLYNRRRNGWCDTCLLTLPKHSQCPHKAIVGTRMTATAP